MVLRGAILDKNALLQPILVRTTPVQTLTEQSHLLDSKTAVGLQWAPDVNVVSEVASQDNNALLRPILVRTPLAQMLTEQNRSLDTNVYVVLRDAIQDKNALL